MDSINILENKKQVILYSLEQQSWVRVDKKYLQSLELKDLKYFLEKYHLTSLAPQEEEINKEIQSLYIFLTRKCNMSCEFCSMDASPTVDISKELSIEETINFLKGMHSFHIRRIVLSGGEPLISEKLYPLIEYIYKEMKNTKIIVQTNGVIINRKFCEKVEGKIERVNISIESIYNIWSDKREDLISRLRIVGDYNLKMEFSFVVTKENQEFVYDYIELCRYFNAEAGIKIVSAIGGEKRFDNLCLSEIDILKFYQSVINYIIEHDYIIEKNLETILGYRPIPRKGCSAYSLKSFSVLPDGEIRRCHSIKGKDYNCIGNIKSIPIHKKYNEKCEIEENFSVDTKVYCRTCIYKHFCTGVCSAEVYNCLDNTFYKPSCCEWKKVLIEYYLWDHNHNNNASLWEGINTRLTNKLEEIYEES